MDLHDEIKMESTLLNTTDHNTPHIESDVLEFLRNNCSSPFGGDRVTDTGSDVTVKEESPTVPERFIQTRTKERKHYTDEDIGDDEIEGKRSYNIEDKLQRNNYKGDYVLLMKGDEFTLKYVQEHGLLMPILFHDKTGLGMRVPSENFKVSDVKQCVGSRRMLDVMDVNTQKGLEMTVKEWVKYYENPERDRLLNVISLEFSHTRLENYVESPTLVRQLDWVDRVWPRHLKECQTESTNIIEKMKYPKVQKYCLMSVGNCYTDFHIDFGGTSVWYHILHGEKVFWLIPPTTKNIEIYENWVLSAKQGDIFLPDQVDECQKVCLKSGDTFIIPSGWIHAVFTPVDSLVFGGNFLHSFNILQQLRVAEVEDKTHVPQKFRYPFYSEMLWYVLTRYVSCVTGKNYIKKHEKEKEDIDDQPDSPGSFVYDDDSRPPSRNPDSRPPSRNPDSRPPSRNPEDPMPLDMSKMKIDKDEIQPKLSKRITIELTRIDVSPLKKSHSDDESSSPRRLQSPRKCASDSALAESSRLSGVLNGGTESKVDINGVKEEVPEKGDGEKPQQKWIHLTKYELEGLGKLLEKVESLPLSKRGVPKDLIDPDAVLQDVQQMLDDHQNDDPKRAVTGEPICWVPETTKKAKPKGRMGFVGSKVVKSASKGSSSNIRRRRTRCKRCEACTRQDCGECNFCKDMRKYGGPGRMKQSCISRQCMAPVLPHTAVCMICGEDERIKDDDSEESTTTLMECGICWEIVHAPCLKKKYENLDNEGNINEDLPNSWECAKCCHDGKQGQLKPRVMKGGVKAKTIDSRRSSANSDGTPEPRVKEKLTPVKAVEGKRVIAKETMSLTISHSIKGRPQLLQREKLVKKAIKQKVEQQRSRKRGKLLKQAKRMQSWKVKKILPQARATIIPEGHVDIITRSGRTVKRSPQLTSDDEITGPLTKRPRREALSPHRAGRVGQSASTPQLKLHPHLTRPHPRNRRALLSAKLERDGDHVQPGKGRGRGKRIRDDDRPWRGGEVIHRSHGRNIIQSGQDSPAYTKYGHRDGDSDSAGRPGRTYRGRGVNGQGNFNDKASSSDRSGTSGDQPSGSPAIKMRKADGHQEPVCDKELRVVLERHVVRPAPVPPPSDEFEMVSGQAHPLRRKIWMIIFSELKAEDLASCLCVCRTWNRWCIDRSLWKKIDLSKQKVTQQHLMGIVRRQPDTLILSQAVITPKQLNWLVSRLPQLKELDLSYSTWATIEGLCSSSCPLLFSLSLNWSVGVQDNSFHDLVLPPVDRKPALKDVSRLHRLKSLSLAGNEVTDQSMETITKYIPKLEKLNLSYCMRLTNRGIETLLSRDSVLTKSLKEIDLSGCAHLSEHILMALKMAPEIEFVNLRACQKISQQACQKFADTYIFRPLSVIADKMIISSRKSNIR